jgi:hypothetical protein
VPVWWFTKGHHKASALLAGLKKNWQNPQAEFRLKRIDPSDECVEWKNNGKKAAGSPSGPAASPMDQCGSTIENGRSVGFPAAVPVIQHLFEVAAFGFKQLGAAGNFTQADFVRGSNFPLGLAFMEVFEQLPAKGEGVDFAGRENFLEEHFHFFVIPCLGEEVDQLPGNGIHEDGPFVAAGCRHVCSYLTSASEPKIIGQLFLVTTSGKKCLILTGRLYT